MKKISVFAWAFLALLVAFFTAGAFALGTTKTTGKALACEADKTAYYTVELDSGERLAAVYINVGSVYAPVGGDAVATVEYSASSSSTSNWKKVAPSVTIGNTESVEGVSGGNYNWLCYAEGKDLQNVKRLSFSTDCNLELYEIVCLNEAGEPIALSVGKNGSNGTDYADEEVAASIDSQDDFYKKTGAYYAYAQDECRALTAARNVMQGTAVTEGSVYTLGEGYNYLATLLQIPALALFGVSPFALRIAPFIALCVCAVFLYLIAKELLKKDGYALCFGAFGLLAAATVLRTAGAAAFVASAVLGAAYFACRFFTRGISSGRIVRGGLNVLFSGAVGAVALATDTTAVFPVSGVLALLAAGLIRQKKAYGNAAAKATTDEEREKLRYDYGYKTRVSYCFAALSFVVFAFVLLLVSAVLCYPAILRAHGSSTGFVTAMGLGLKAGLRIEDAGGRLRLLKWFVGAGMPVFARIVCIVGLLAFVCATAFVAYGFIKKTADKRALRVRRTYFVLAGALASCVLAWLVKGGVAATPSALFLAAYLGFAPLCLAAALALKKGKEQ